MKKLNLLLALLLISASTFAQKEHLSLFALFPDMPQSMSNADLQKNASTAAAIPEEYNELISHHGFTKVVPVGKVESGKYMLLFFSRIDSDGVFDIHFASFNKKTGEEMQSSSYLTQSGKNSRYAYEGSFKRSGKDMISFYVKTTEGSDVTEEEKMYKLDEYLSFEKNL